MKPFYPWKISDYYARQPDGSYQCEHSIGERYVIVTIRKLTTKRSEPWRVEYDQYESGKWTQNHVAKTTKTLREAVAFAVNVWG